MARSKRYYDFTNELSSDEIYEGLLAYGLFTEKLPPIFTAKGFFDYCKEHSSSFRSRMITDYIYYESMRNINTPRPFGIPNPISYHRLCKYISEIWHLLQEYFENETKGQNHKISRIHIRKMRDTPAIFFMNYKNWKVDGTPEPDLLLGAKYLVHADISNCFPSIYTHALSWALVGKDEAKRNQTTHHQWYTQLDKYTRNIKHGETHGLLIGPHVSNLLSEIILVKIDKVLYEKGWRYIRNIDDYTCYVSTYEQGQLFLIDLAEQLREYDLLLNHKKTSIKELPKASVEQWVRRINGFTAFNKSEKMKFTEIRAYLDMVVELMEENNEDTAILNYAMKVLEKNASLTDNAKEYYIKTIFHYTVIYPYLVSLLEDFVFKPFGVERTMISKIARLLYEDGIRAKNYEAVCYALYFAIKYEFEINNHYFDDAKKSNHCLFLLFSYLYFKKNDDEEVVALCKEHARLLKENEMDSYWLFIYEVLPEDEFRDEWNAMKKKKVTFIKDI